MLGNASPNLIDEREDLTSPEQALEEEIEHRALDETKADVLRRERAEARDLRVRNVLGDSKRARAKYRDIAEAEVPPSRGNRTATQNTKPADVRPWCLTHAEFRLLSYLLRKANPDLSNCFPSRRTAAKALRRKESTCRKLFKALREKGWIRTHAFHYETGRQSSNGVQFFIPAGVLPMSEAWAGPTRFTNRLDEDPKSEST